MLTCQTLNNTYTNIYNSKMLWTMRKIILILLMSLILMGLCNSCLVTGLNDFTYEQYENNEYVVVNDGVCYVYYAQPSTTFLNTLYVNDGAYYYWYVDKYIPVVFPRWKAWSPQRFFYYDRNRWMWRNRRNYNSIDFRRPPIKLIPPQNMRPRSNNNFHRQGGNMFNKGDGKRPQHDNNHRR